MRIVFGNGAKMSINCLFLNSQRFMRKGQVGDWKEHFSAEDNQAWDEWAEKWMTDTGINRDFVKYLK